MQIKVGRKIISADVKVAKSIWSKIIGLMFFQKGELLMDFGEEQSVRIHTFLCVHMNLMFISNSGRVVKLIKAQPWQEFAPVRARYVFETTNTKKFVNEGEKVSLS
jgi:uncharacterized membrane protein (UPF0127 family)